MNALASYGYLGNAGVSVRAEGNPNTLAVKVYLSNDNGERAWVYAGGVDVDDAVAHAESYANRRVSDRFASFAMDEWEAA